MSEEFDEYTARRQADADAEYRERQIEEAVADYKALCEKLAEALKRASALAEFFFIESEQEGRDFFDPDAERGVPGHWSIDVDPATNDGYPRVSGTDYAKDSMPSIRAALAAARDAGVIW